MLFQSNSFKFKGNTPTNEVTRTSKNKICIWKVMLGKRRLFINLWYNIEDPYFCQDEIIIEKIIIIFTL